MKSDSCAARENTAAPQAEGRIAVIGLGNTLRRDDGIGIRLLALLQDTFSDEKVAFLNFGISSFGLVNTIREFSKVLLIDAIDAGLPPGELRIFKLGEASFPTQHKKFSSHELALGDLVNLCQALGVVTDIHIAGIQVQNVSYGLEMTPELEAAQPAIAGRLAAFLKGWLAPDETRATA